MSQMKTSKRAVLLDVRTLHIMKQALASAYSYLHALDLLEAQRWGFPEVRHSQIAIDVQQCLEIVEDHIKQALLDSYERLPEPVPEDQYGPASTEDAEEDEDGFWDDEADYYEDDDFKDLDVE